VRVEIYYYYYIYLHKSENSPITVILSISLFITLEYFQSFRIVYVFAVPLGVLMEKYESKLEDDEKPNSGTAADKDDDDFFDESGE
jgi:hypothetical protein